MRVKPHRCQPVRMEPEEGVSIDATPDELAEVALRPIKVKVIEDSDAWPLG